MKQIIKDLGIMAFEYVGCLIFGNILILNNLGTSYAIKDFVETPALLISFITLGIFFLCMVYGAIMLWRKK